MPHISKMSSNLNFSVDDDFGGGSHDGSILESVVNGPLSPAPILLNFLMDRMVYSFYKI